MVRMIGAICVGTVLTQIILMGYFATRGTLNGGTVAQVVALMNGIDVSGDRLRELWKENEEHEAPSYEEVLEARKEKGLEMDSRYDSLIRLSQELGTMSDSLSQEVVRFDARRTEYEDYRDQQMSGENDAGTKEHARILQELEPGAAKDQLLRHYDDDEIDYVVNLVKAMSSEKQIEVLQEFTLDKPDELRDILTRIGRPSLSLAVEGAEE